MMKYISAYQHNITTYSFGAIIQKYFNFPSKKMEFRHFHLIFGAKRKKYLFVWNSKIQRCLIWFLARKLKKQIKKLIIRIIQTLRIFIFTQLSNLWNATFDLQNQWLQLIMSIENSNTSMYQRLWKGKKLSWCHSSVNLLT